MARAAGRSISREATRGALIRQVEEFLGYSVGKEDRERILSSFYQKFGISRGKVMSENQMFLTLPQIKQMAQDGIEFGNHGQSHSPLSALSQKEQEMEIVNSKRTITENLETEFIPFAYPFGNSRDFTPETNEIVKRNGHSCAVTTRHTLNLSGISRYELGRIHIGEIPPYRMALELEKTFLKNIMRKVGIWREAME